MPKVLIVDDEPQYGEFLRDWLSREGHEVKAVTTAEDAIDFGREWLPRVLVADWMLASPLDGLKVSEAVRAANPQLQTILITGYPSRELKALAEKARVHSFIEKPFSLAEVAAAVRQAAADTHPLLAGQMLIVSESPTASELVVAALQAARYRCHVARTAEEAHQVLRECRNVHFAVFDCTAPCSDLALLAVELRQLQPNLLIIGSSEGNDGERFAALGIDHFLPRFWDVDELHSLLVKRIDRCPQCGLAWPLRQPLPGDAIRTWKCRGCGSTREAVLLDDASDRLRRNVREVVQVE
jgi:DNA-binding response OmpR family regulator